MTTSSSKSFLGTRVSRVSLEPWLEGSWEMALTGPGGGTGTGEGLDETELG